MFKSLKNVKAARHIIDQIRSAILEGKVAPGEKLQSEKNLMEDFGVSKATIREALRVLEYMGLVEIRQGASGGVFAAEVDMKITQESLSNFLYFKNVSVEHLSEIRKVLEPYAARTAAAVISAEDLEKLQQINEKCKTDLREGREKDARKSLVDFHRIIARCTQNPILILILAFVEDLLEDTKDLLKPEDRFSRSVIEAHEEIYAALVDRDAERAFALMLRDVAEVEKDLVRIQNRPRIV